jgi:hypothetical protein
MAGLIAERHADPDLESALTVLWASRQSMVAAVIRRGLDAGELREGLDEATVLDLLAGPAYYRLLVTGQPLNRSAARRQADALIAAVLR